MGEEMNQDFENAGQARKQYYYCLERIEELRDGWQVVFMTSDQDDVINDHDDTPPYDELQDLFRKYYGADVDNGRKWDIGAAENWHCCTVATEDEAEARLGEIMYILDVAGFGETDMSREEISFDLEPIAIEPVGSQNQGDSPQP